VADRFSCVARFLALGEPCYGTASQVRRWILVEQPGAWGADAPRESDLPLAVAEALSSAARAVGARLLLVRRHGRSTPVDRQAFGVVSATEVRRVERLRFTDPEELLAIDWEPLRRLAPVGGEPVAEPLYLTCTNGKHDACCAEFGRPVAAALDAATGQQAWEVSHIGGDRFAGNLLVLPDGLYYGRVTPETALDVVVHHRAGRLLLPHLRGRSSLPFPAQAAEHLVRAERDLDGIDDLRFLAVEDLDGGRKTVTFAVADGTVLAVTVECSEAIDPQQLTCRSTSEEHPPRFRLLSLDEVGKAAG
jgi:hypothetical protein